MDPRVSEVARGALQRLMSGDEAGVAPRPDAAFRIGPLSLIQLSRLAYLQAGDPLVDQVLDALKAGRPVVLDRTATEAAIRAHEYPPLVQEQFRRWFARLSEYGIAVGDSQTAPRGASAEAARPQASPPPSPAPPVRGVAALTPDRQILSQILGEAVPEAHPCWLEPKKACCGSGRCKQLGF